MFGKFREPTQLDKAIARATRELDSHPVESDEYAQILEILSKLHKLKDAERQKQVSNDTLILAGTNLLGILMVIRHEHINVITSRAMGMIQKPK